MALGVTLQYDTYLSPRRWFRWILNALDLTALSLHINKYIQYLYKSPYIVVCACGRLISGVYWIKHEVS